ncbi:MAG: hypothetical protein NUV90_01655 [Candidatus Parcubacteria bacterium]|nr:hypothetical protein [Candidatus Parcubacteria bacterium]
MRHTLLPDHSSADKRSIAKSYAFLSAAMLAFVFLFFVTRGAVPQSSELAYLEYSPLGQSAGSVVPASCDSVPPTDHFRDDCFPTSCVVSPTNPKVGDTVTWSVGPVDIESVKYPGGSYVYKAYFGTNPVYTANPDSGKWARYQTSTTKVYTSPGTQYATLLITLNFLGWGGFVEESCSVEILPARLKCGSAAGQATSVKPSLNLCQTGEASTPVLMCYDEGDNEWGLCSDRYFRNGNDGQKWEWNCHDNISANTVGLCSAPYTSSPATPITPITPVTPTLPSTSAPTASITANPLSVAYNGHSTLTWSSTNATSCTAGGDWSNLNPDSGTQFNGEGLTDSLITDTTFTFQCTGPGGTSPLSSVTVSVLPPVCENGANDPPGCSQCPDGQAFIGQSCDVCENDGCSSGPVGGGTPYNPTGSLVCNNGANDPPECKTFTPTATLSANPKIVDVGQSTTLTWGSDNATSCTGSGFSTGGATQSPSDGASSGPLNTPGTVSFSLTCSSDAGGTSLPASDSVTVLDPSAFMTVSPARVPKGSPAQVSWGASGVSSCVVTGPSGMLASGASDDTTFSFPVGSREVVIEGQSTFTITCQTTGAPFVRSATVNILTIFEEF